ncbi:MAG: B12-binding domain-containing radical SAM protein [Phycisphaerae bacterium]
MRILLIQPDFQSSLAGFRRAAMPEPLGLEMLAAVAGEHEVRILDMRLDGDLDAAFNEFSPDLVGVTALTPEVYAAHDVLRHVRQLSSETFTFVGGHHATLLPQDFHQPFVDAIVPGEGEIIFPRLLAELAKGPDLSGVPGLIRRGSDGTFITNPGGPDDLDMDALPLPRRDLTVPYRDEYFFLFDKPDSSVATGRGCPYRCNFCSVWKFYEGRTRQMSADRVVREVAGIETDHITFVDDNFLMNYRRENEIADRIKAEGIRKRYSMECRTDSIVRHPELVEKWVDIGLYAVLLGLEGSDRTLKSVNKKNSADVNNEAIRILQDLGVIIWGAFIADPGWDVADFQDLREYVSRHHITHTQFTVLTPLPGSELWRDRYDELITHDYTCYDCLHSVLPTKLPRDEFYQQFAKLYHQNDLTPYYELVSDGKLTIDDCRRGKAMLDEMSEWTNYIPGDPVLSQLSADESPSQRKGHFTSDTGSAIGEANQ